MFISFTFFIVNIFQSATSMAELSAEELSRYSTAVFVGKRKWLSCFSPLLQPNIFRQF